MSGTAITPINQPPVASYATCSLSEPADRAARWGVLLCIAVVVSACLTYLSGTESYEERLANIVAKRNLPGHIYEAASDSKVLRELFLVSAGDRELTAKQELALLKYGQAARDVLEMFGGDTDFQTILRRHGEGVVPIVEYFMANDMLTLKGMNSVQQEWKKAWGSIIDLVSRKRSEPRPVPIEYGPRFRGIYAIEAILLDGHHFLGQFAIGPDNRVQRIQSDRVLETLKKLFAGGVTDLETKFRTGVRIEPSDVAWAGIDVFSAFGATKLLKYLGEVRAVVEPAEEAAVISRTTLMGRGVLLGESLGKRVAGWGAKAASVYLLVRHPSLLSGVFSALGDLVGLPAWMSALIGWWVMALIALLLILPVLRGVTLLIPPLRFIAWMAAWLLPAQSRPKPSPL